MDYFPLSGQTCAQEAKIFATLRLEIAACRRKCLFCHSKRVRYPLEQGYHWSCMENPTVPTKNASFPPPGPHRFLLKLLLDNANFLSLFIVSAYSVCNLFSLWLNSFFPQRWSYLICPRNWQHQSWSETISSKWAQLLMDRCSPKSCWYPL